jgi:peptidoglycan/xylan/chitin deacetylase (PgdA/CDA1 family)
MRAQIRSCQEYLGARADAAPLAIAYPYGRFDERVVRAARAEGLRLGATTARGKNRLPLADAAAMRIKRHCLVPGPALFEECLLSRSDLGIVHLLRRFAPKFQDPSSKFQVGQKNQT